MGGGLESWQTVHGGVPSQQGRLSGPFLFASIPVNRVRDRQERRFIAEVRDIRRRTCAGLARRGAAPATEGLEPGIATVAPQPRR